MSLPAFIDLEEKDQAIDLRTYLKEKGADISEDLHEAGPVPDLITIIGASGVVFADGTDEQDILSIYNNVISLILVLPDDKTDELVNTLCEKLREGAEETDRHASTKLKIMNHLFNALPESSTGRYIVYMAILRLAAPKDLMHDVVTDLPTIKRWIAAWDISEEKVSALWRKLHDSLVQVNNNEQATRVMVELLSGYTDENASHAREDAHKCIVTSLADPQMYLMDQLLKLKPVKFLEGEPIHDLLTIFVSGKLSQYMSFYEKNEAFVTGLGLSHERNMHKMRLLTFMQLGETNEELSFTTIQSEMRLEEHEVEQFVIDVIRSGTVRAKMDQLQRRVTISSTTNRTFGRQHWQHLRENLDVWQCNLTQVLSSLQHVATPQP